MNACDLWESQPINKQLLEGYKVFSTSLLVSPETASRLSCPLYIHLGPNFHKFAQRVFVVGQETFDRNKKSGWIGNPLTVGNNFSSFVNYTNNQPCREHVMMETQSLWLIDHLKSSRSVFHHALKKISRTKNGIDFLNSGFVWDDLVAMDYRGGSIGKIPKSKKRTEVNAIWKYSQKKFTMEVEIAKPTHIIFLTGETDTYDECLEWILGLDFKVKDQSSLILPQNSKIVDEVKCFTWKGIQCYRTLHPRDMRSKQKTSIIDDLASLFELG